MAVNTPATIVPHPSASGPGGPGLKAQPPRQQYLDLRASVHKKLLARLNLEALAQSDRARAESEIRMLFGEILAEEFMKPNGISQNRLARDLDVNPARVNDVVHGRSAITAPLALRLAKYFGTTPELWMNLQGSYELRRARATDWPRIERRVRVLAAE